MVRDLILTTAPGLERPLVEELASLGFEAKPGIGRVYLKGDVRDVIRINAESALTHRVFIVLKEFEIPVDSKERAFQVIEREVYDIPREERLNPSKPFAIRGERYPKEFPHPFTSVDLGVPGGSAVIRRILEKTGRRIPVDLKKPAYEIFIEVVERLVRVKVNTTGESLHKRGYRIRGHPASLSTTIARFMARKALSERLCDPMCGSGTILLEAWLEHQGVPIGRIRSKTYGRLRKHLKPFEGSIREDPGNERRPQELTFGDRSSRHLDAAIANSISVSRLAEAPRGFRVFDLARYRLWDITKLDELDADAIATNPPYGLRLGDPKSVEPVYEALFRLAKGKRLVLITPRDDLVKRYAPEPDEVWPVMHGDLSVRIYVWNNI